MLQIYINEIEFNISILHFRIKFKTCISVKKMLCRTALCRSFVSNSRKSKYTPKKLIQLILAVFCQ